MRKVIKDIYIGDIQDAYEVLCKPKASHIKSMLSVTYSRLPMTKGIPRLIIPVEDDGLKISFDDINLAVTFLKAAPKPCLSHCDAGINRSTLMVMAYLISEGMSLDEAIKTARDTSWLGPALDMLDLLARWARKFKYL